MPPNHGASGKPRPSPALGPIEPWGFDDTYVFQGSGAYNGFPTSTNRAPPSAYNPALLLNPRGFDPSVLSRNVANDTATNMPTVGSGPIEFQFSTPNSDFMTTNGMSGQVDNNGIHGQVNAYKNGIGSMIERMNNVEHRSAVPQPKRRRLDGSEEVAPMSGFGSGGAGIVGQYVRDRREEGANNPSMKRVETVDLTDGVAEDSDVVVIERPNDEEVCYGMIQGAKLNCHIVPRPKPGSVSLTHGYWPQVKVVLKRKQGDPSNIIEAYDYTRQIVGRVDGTTALGLSPLLDSRLQLRTDCRIPSRKRMENESSGRQTSAAYTLDLMLYGPRKSGKAVGRHLSQKNLWLRNPPRIEAGFSFWNPQVIEGPKPPTALKDRNVAPTPSGPVMTRTVEEIRSEVMGVFDSLTKNEDLPEMEPHPMILTELLKHQKQGLHFMMTKEEPRQLNNNSPTADSFWQVRHGHSGQRIYYNVVTGHEQRDRPPETFGGILADMMGLGKTLSILSLISKTLDGAEEWAGREPIQPQAPVKKPNGQSSRHFNVPTAEPLGLTTVKRNGRATLLICPLSTVTNWEEQIRAHVQPDGLKCYIYHGSNRIKDVETLAGFDIVITTYGSVASEVNARSRGRGGSYPLEEISWYRVVLDEAHMIREQATLQFKAICRLQAHCRWAVTGTPVQNKLDDLGALLAFLRLKPFDERGKFTQYIVAPFKNCDPEIVPKLRVLVDSITLRRLKDKINLPARTDHIIKLDFSPAEHKLYKLFETRAHDKVQVLASGHGEKLLSGRTYIHILQSILRLRLISAHGRDLLNDEDLELVQGMTEESAIDLDSDNENEKPAVAERRVYEAFELMQQTGVDVCAVCQKKIGGNDNSDITSEREEDIIGYMTADFHAFCPRCISVWEEEAGNRGYGPCPICQNHTRYAYSEIRKSKSDVEHEGLHPTKSGSKGKTIENYSGPHTKTRALLEDLQNSEAKSAANPLEAPIKSVVFSGWTSHLDLIQFALDNAGIRYTRLDGKMSRIARTNAMDAFREDPSVHVILVSIMAGGLGLNLTSGSNVYVMEPQYNPAAEAQAVDRVHRLGQKREVRTVRYIMRESIEEKMLELQDKKKKLASLSMDRSQVMDKAEAAKQKLQDLRTLFR